AFGEVRDDLGELVWVELDEQAVMWCGGVKHRESGFAVRVERGRLGADDEAELAAGARGSGGRPGIRLRGGGRLDGSGRLRFGGLRLGGLARGRSGGGRGGGGLRRSGFSGL